jgi:hypothetical protein
MSNTNKILKMKFKTNYELTIIKINHNHQRKIINLELFMNTGSSILEKKFREGLTLVTFGLKYYYFLKFY